jgi:hypothetical protein
MHNGPEDFVLKSLDYSNVARLNDCTHLNKIKSFFYLFPHKICIRAKEPKGTQYKIARNAVLKCALQDGRILTVFINITRNIFTS